jgi:hypothetical protein
MVKLAAFAGATVGGWLGWMLGAEGGLTTAFIMSMAGTALGWYAGGRVIKNFLGY